MNLDELDCWLSIIYIAICLINMGMMYLFFFRFPQEIKKPSFNSRIYKRKHGYAKRTVR